MREYIFELVDADDPDIAKRKRATRKILLISLTCIFIAVVLIAIVIGVVMKDQADRKLLRTDEEGQTQPSDSSKLTFLLASSFKTADSSLSKQTSALLTPHIKSINYSLTDSLLIHVSSSLMYTSHVDSSLVISPPTSTSIVVNTNTHKHTDSLLLISSLTQTLDSDINTKPWMNSSEIQKSANLKDSTQTVIPDYLITPSSIVEFDSSLTEYGVPSSVSVVMHSSKSKDISISDSVILQISTAPVSTDMIQISTTFMNSDMSHIFTAPISTGFHPSSSASQISSLVTGLASEASDMTSSEVLSDNTFSFSIHNQSLGLSTVYMTSVISAVSLVGQSELIPHAESNSSLGQHIRSHTSMFSDGSPVYSTAPPVRKSVHGLTTFSTISSQKAASTLQNLSVTSLMTEYLQSFETTQTKFTSVLSKVVTSRSVSERHTIYSLLQITSTASASAVPVTKKFSDSQIPVQTMLSFIELTKSSRFPASFMATMEGDASVNAVLSSSPAVFLTSEVGGSTENLLESSYTASHPAALLTSEVGGSTENIESSYTASHPPILLTSEVGGSIATPLESSYTASHPSVLLTSEVGGSTENLLESSYTVPYTVNLEMFSPLSSVTAALHVTTSQLITSSITVYITPSFTLNITQSPFVVFTPGETESEGMTRPPVTNATAPVLPSMTAATSSLATTTMTTVTTTTTSSIAQTTVTPCPGDKFGCDDGTCIPKLLYCDGRVHCPDGSDETQNCKCGDSQMTCASGQCVAITARCDKIYQCQDKSDEYNCTSCLGSQCASGLCLWRFARCDHKVDCEDLSDELNCPFRLGYRRCDNGIWIMASDWCDGVDDCYDNSDEASCSCDKETEVKCLDSMCIRKEWVCDGHIDCINMTDELSCNKCHPGEFQCHDYRCVPMDTVCDDKPNCKDGRDEMDCYELQGSNSSTAGLTYLRRGQDTLPMCSTHWTADISSLVCQKLGHQKAEETAFSPANNTSVSYYQLTQAIQHTESLLSHLTKVSECNTDQIVKLKCMQKECGKRQDTVIAYIAGAELSPAGRWPWVASLSYLGQPVCAAAIISEQWLVTAGHCVTSPGSHDHSQTPFYVEALLGSVKRTRDPGIGSSVILVDKIVTHPDFLVTDIGPVLWDIALLHLETRIQFTDFIQPICLPDAVTPRGHCFLAGWGKIDSNQAVTPEYLREAKLNIWSDEDCEKNTVHMEVKVNTNITLCAGYSTGVMSACQGDSGGPLMCEDTRGRWYLAGITSSGAANCGVTTSRADRFTRISGVVDWIRNITMVT